MPGGQVFFLGNVRPVVSQLHRINTVCVLLLRKLRPIQPRQLAEMTIASCFLLNSSDRVLTGLDRSEAERDILSVHSATYQYCIR